MRCRHLRENGKYIPKQAFLARKEYLLRKDGLVIKGKEKVGQVNPYVVSEYNLALTTLFNVVYG